MRFAPLLNDAMMNIIQTTATAADAIGSQSEGTKRCSYQILSGQM